MQAAPTAGIDLPLKALIWQDDAGATWLSYNDPHWIATATVWAHRRPTASAAAIAAFAKHATEGG